MSNVIGLDLGTNSIGWALRNPNRDGNQIEKFGVLTFKKGVGIDKTGEYSYAAERTKKRSVRRLYQARKYRLWDTLRHLIQLGYCPLTIEALNKWRHYDKQEAIKNSNGGRVYPVEDHAFDAWIKLDFNGDGKPDYTSPYQLRKELATVQLDMDVEMDRAKLGRALYHIAQRRGFKSSRKSGEDLKDGRSEDSDMIDLQVSEKKKNRRIDEEFQKYPEAKTIGHLFALLEDNNERVRERIAQFAIRENYKDEIRFIFENQGLGVTNKLYELLVESGRNKNDGSIFYKRPLRSQKGLIGKCTLEPAKYRSPISHPEFEIFRAWSFLNNIKYREVADAKGIWNQLPLELLQEIYTSKFFRKSKAYFPFSEIRELIEHKGYKWHLNFKDKTSVTSCPVSARLKDIFGEDYLDVRVPKLNLEIEGGKDYYSLDDIWHILFNFEDQEFVANFAAEKLGLDATGVKKFITTWATLPIGYGMLSLNAIRKINRFLQRGLIYTESVLLANVPTLIGENIWMESEDYILKQISIVIDDNRRQKDILSIVNRLIAVHKNLESYEQYGGVDYQLDDEDHRDIIKAIHAHYGESNWLALKGEHATFIETAVAVCYQAYFKKSNTSIRYLAGERYFPVRSGNTEFLRGDTGFYRLPKLIDTLGEFLQLSFNIPDELLNRIYHPSEIDIYKPATDENGQLALGSPKTGAFKNPMAMRTLFSLRKLINHLINTRQIDSHTRVVVEVARELNDSNKRWAIEAWQRQREAENQEFSYAIEQLQGIHGRISALTASETDIDKIRIWFEQNDEETIPPLATAKKEVKGIRWNENVKSSYKQIVSQKQWVDKYRLWQEQQCQCMYTGKVINISDLFNDNVIDFEHTLPRSKSFDNSLANLTVCYADYNRNIKKNQIPFNLNNYDKEYGGYSAILPRLDKWKEKVERIKQQIDFWKTKSKRSSDKEYKDEAIRQKHLWSMELEYWKNKLDRFTMKEITDGFKNSQKVDTQLISKYAFHYLKTYFNKVDVQKGKMTSDFRKIYGLQVADQKKDRSKHSHHAKDAAVLTLIPTALKRDAILKEYYEAQEKKLPYSGMKPYEGFKREFVWGIDDTVLINNVPNVQYLSPAKRKVRKRGKEQYIPGTSKVMWATGDSIRGQLHQETSYGAIKPAIRDEKGLALKDEKGKYIQEDKVKYVIRVPFIYKKDPNSPGFKSLEEVEKQIVDVGLKLQIRKQVEAAESFKDAMNEGIFMLNKAGDKVNRIRHIRVWASVSDPLKIKLQTNQSDAEYKRYYYAANATNSYFALYLNDNQKAFKFRNLMETAQIKSNLNIKNPVELFDARVSVIKGRNKVELPLKYVLIAGTKVFFKKDKNEQISDLSIREQLNRLYIFTGFEKNGDSARLNFKYHLEARNKIIEEFIESEINFDHPKPTLRFGYAKYDFAVEGYDFEVAVDGAITWK